PSTWWRTWSGQTFKMSQASWNPENLGQSTIQILRDPGWLLKWIGSLLIVTGVFLLFYVQRFRPQYATANSKRIVAPSPAPEARGENDGRHMTLLSELRYIDPDGVVWIAPTGSVVDGASIPRVLWSFMGGPFDGKYRNASVLHDVAYDQKTRPWKEADRMFYNAMRCSGVSPTEAKTMYYALYRHGRHWKYLRGVAIASAGDEQTVPRALPVSEEE